METEKSKGNEPSWEDKELNGVNFTTNYGGVMVEKDTWQLISCCVGLGRNQGNVQMQIKILGDEFQIARDTFGTIWAELCSADYSYKLSYRNPKSIEIREVLRMIQKDDNNSVAAVLVKKTLVLLMLRKLRFSKDDLNELERVYTVWRKPILKRDLIDRTPIVVRTPIVTARRSA